MGNVNLIYERKLVKFNYFKQRILQVKVVPIDYNILIV